MPPMHLQGNLSAAGTVLASALGLPGSCAPMSGSTVWKAVTTAHDENIKDYAKGLQMLPEGATP